MRVLVTGGTGYIGGRLVPGLLAAGHEVRCMARAPERLRDHPWRERVEAVRGDAADPGSLRPALQGVDTAYYLVHALGSGPDFAERDARAAQGFAAAAAAEGVGRIVYLGGMAPSGAARLSGHLASRREVGKAFLDGPVPATVLQAAVVLGSGSASFEMLRHLTERLPVMVAPRWVRTRVQPIAVRDVLRLLTECADPAAAAPDAPAGAFDRAFDVGGPEVLTYADLIHRYARAAGVRRRLIVPVPLLTPRLSGLWVGLVTPVPGALARPLVDSLRNEVVCREDDLSALLGDSGRTGVDEALRLALRRVAEADVATRWSSASWPADPSAALPSDPDWTGGALCRDERTAATAAGPAALWRVIEGIGGESGWYSWPLAWFLRGAADRALGGAGLRRGRRDPARLRIGDTVDFWRVEEIRPGRLLRLRAEMRLPGRAVLELSAGTDERGRTVLHQRALFQPRGLAGRLYWWGLAPFHGIVFGAMARNIAAAAERGPIPGAAGPESPTGSGPGHRPPSGAGEPGQR